MPVQAVAQQIPCAQNPESQSVPCTQAAPIGARLTARVRDIAAAIDGHQVVIVAGATGSWKTTQLP